MTSQPILFPLRGGEDFIELYKLLKAEGLVEGGGEAKHVVAEGLVNVNGVVETRKRKKLVLGDQVEFQGTRLEIVAAS